MSLDRLQKKPHDYRVPAGRQRCAPAFADSDRLMIDGGRVCLSIEAGTGPVDPPVPPAQAPRNDSQPLRGVALPVVCVVVGLALGIAIGTATAPEAPPPAAQRLAPATPASMTDGSAAPDAEHPAADRAASEGGSADRDPLGPTTLPGQ